MPSMDETMRAGGYVSAATAAAASARDISTIHRQVGRGDLVSTRAGNQLYIALDSLLAMYADNEVISKRVKAL